MNRSTGASFRPLYDGDRDLLVAATLGNLNWCGTRFTRDDVERTPALAHYADFRPDRGDFGVVAYDGDSVLGVAWALFLDAGDPGYGYLDDDTPELSVWVAEGARGRGIGRAVTRRTLDTAVERRIARISLSVEPDNVVAVALYRSLGFVSVPGRESDGLMIRRFSAGTRRRGHEFV